MTSPTGWERVNFSAALVVKLRPVAARTLEFDYAFVRSFQVEKRQQVVTHVTGEQEVVTHVFAAVLAELGRELRRREQHFDPERGAFHGVSQNA